MIRFRVERRFSSWIGEVFDVVDIEDGNVIAVVRGDHAEKRAQGLVDEANALAERRVSAEMKG